MPTETSCRRSSTPAQTATILLLTLLAGAASAAAKPKEFSKIDAVIEQKMKAHLIPGIAVVIMLGDEVVHSFASGSGASGPITPDTPFIIGSLSKLFTATAVMQLVDAGLVELDAPVERYLPDFRTANETTFGTCSIRTAAFPETLRARQYQIRDCRTMSPPLPRRHWSRSPVALTFTPVRIIRCLAP